MYLFEIEIPIFVLAGCGGSVIKHAHVSMTSERGSL